MCKGGGLLHGWTITSPHGVSTPNCPGTALSESMVYQPDGACGFRPSSMAPVTGVTSEVRSGAGGWEWGPDWCDERGAKWCRGMGVGATLGVRCGAPVCALVWVAPWPIPVSNPRPHLMFRHAVGETLYFVCATLVLGHSCVGVGVKKL
jgi:hypothetical protein